MRMPLLLSVCCALSAFTSVTQASSAPAPVIVTVPVDSLDRAAPPSDAFMHQGSINPSTETLKKQVDPAPTLTPGSSALPPAAAPAAPSYRTLAAAAAAGVNPMVPKAGPKLIPSRAPAQGLLQQRWTRYALGTLGGLLLLVIISSLRQRFSRERAQD